MNLKTGILAAAAALTLAIPAAALAQPYHGSSYGYGDGGRYASRDYRGDYGRYDDRRFDREREWRREHERRERWEREHRYYGYGYDYYGR